MRKSIFLNSFSRKVDGVIWVPQLTYVNDIEHMKKLDEYGIPYLFLAAYYEQSSAPRCYV
ncbi:MAG: hypothetical protein ACLTBV_33620 [Enterocloster bolteae]